MRIYKFLTLSFFLLLISPSIIQAQFISKNIEIGDTTQVHILNTENGDRFVGRITKIENTTVLFLFQEKKELEFSLAEIRSIVLYKKGINTTKASSPNADYERARAKYYNRVGDKSKPAILHGEENLFFSPTSYTLGKGKKEFRNIMVIYNRLDFGLTDNIDIGFDLMPLLATNVVSARIKAGVPLSDFINVGFGASVFSAFQSRSDAEGITHTYGTATFGNKERFVNIGYGYAFPFRPNEVDGSAILTFGGAFRVGNRWKVMADFILLGEDRQTDYYSFGASWFNDKHRLGFGINAFATNDSFLGPVVPIPFASYALSFGKN